MWTFAKRMMIEIAHFIPENLGLSRNLHGHSFGIYFKLVSDQLGENGTVADIDDLKTIVGKYDHQCLNDFPEFTTILPTAENLAKILADDCFRRFPNLLQVEVGVQETEGSMVYYSTERVKI